MHHHVIPQRTYIAILLSLLFLTIATVWVSFLPVTPSLHLIGALLIAFVKTTLILLYFMHVRYSGKLIWVYALLGFFFVAIFMVITMGDYIALLNPTLSQSPSTHAIPFDEF